MNKNILHTLLAALLLVSAFACTPADNSDDPNVIQDPQGVKLELTWTNNASDPTADTYLDLNLNDGATNLLSASNWYDFGVIDVQDGSLANGTYNLDVYVYDIDRSTNYTITATGNSTGKKYSSSFGPIIVNDKYTSLRPMSMTVSGTKYSFSR